MELDLGMAVALVVCIACFLIGVTLWIANKLGIEREKEFPETVVIEKVPIHKVELKE